MPSPVFAGRESRPNIRRSLELKWRDVKEMRKPGVGQRELAPPSKFSNDGGFRNSVFSAIVSSHPILTSR